MGGETIRMLRRIFELKRDEIGDRRLEKTA
jgi:hypothetical protein